MLGQIDQGDSRSAEEGSLADLGAEFFTQPTRIEARISQIAAAAARAAWARDDDADIDPAEAPGEAVAASRAELSGHTGAIVDFLDDKGVIDTSAFGTGPELLIDGDDAAIAWGWRSCSCPKGRGLLGTLSFEARINSLTTDSDLLRNDVVVRAPR